MAAALRHVPYPDLPALARPRRLRQPARNVFPLLAAAAVERGDALVRVWSAGCASGEEPYSLRLAWNLHAEAAFPSVGVHIIATDVDETMLTRAKAGLYRRGSFRDLPPELVDRAFRCSDDLYEIRAEFRRDIAFLLQDIRSEMPEGPFDPDFPDRLPI